MIVFIERKYHIELLSIEMRVLRRALGSIINREMEDLTPADLRAVQEIYNALDDALRGPDLKDVEAAED